jgi:hypothetical protein
MTTNRDELLARMAVNDKTMIEAHRIFWDAYHAAHKAAGRSIGGTDAGIRALLTHYAMPQRPEGAAVADMGFIEAMKLCDAGLNEWKSKPHNARWWRRIDGTPIPNDLLVCIAEKFAEPMNEQDEAP